jgi:hypothetical protein
VEQETERVTAQALQLQRINSPVGDAGGEGYVTTAINLPRSTMSLLRLVAATRANKDGGRASVSAVLAKLVDDHRAELTSEFESGAAK